MLWCMYCTTGSGVLWWTVLPALVYCSDGSCLLWCTVYLWYWYTVVYCILVVLVYCDVLFCIYLWYWYTVLYVLFIGGTGTVLSVLS